MRCYVTVHNTPLSLKREREVVIGTTGNDVTEVMQPCIHHYLLDPSDQVCRCEGEAHHHAECKKCGECRVYPAVVVQTHKERMQALAVMMGIHHYDEAPKGGAV
jgi:hypothetical protein